MTPTVTKMKLMTQATHNKTANLLHLQFTGLWGVPVGYDSGAHITKDSTPPSIFMLFFLKLHNCWWRRKTHTTTSFWTQLLKDSAHARHNVQETNLFLTIIVQMGHDQKDEVKDYWWI